MCENVVKVGDFLRSGNNQYLDSTRPNVSHEIFWPTVQSKISSWPRPVRLEFFRPGSMMSKETMDEVLKLLKTKEEFEVKRKGNQIEAKECGEYKMSHNGTEIQDHPTDTCSPTNASITNQPTPL